MHKPLRGGYVNVVLRNIAIDWFFSDYLVQSIPSLMQLLTLGADFDGAMSALKSNVWPLFCIWYRYKQSVSVIRTLERSMVGSFGLCFWWESRVRRSVLCWYIWQESGFSHRQDAVISNLIYKKINFVLLMQIAEQCCINVITVSTEMFATIKFDESNYVSVINHRHRSLWIVRRICFLLRWTLLHGEVEWWRREHFELLPGSELLSCDSYSQSQHVLRCSVPKW